jgi:hypothetical protein
MKPVRAAAQSAANTAARAFEANTFDCKACGVTFSEAIRPAERPAAPG